MKQRARRHGHKRTANQRAPVKITYAGAEPVLLAAVSASVPQALEIARRYAGAGEALVVSRGEKVLHRLEPRSSRPDPGTKPA